MRITRTTETQYAVVTDTILQDGESLRADYNMHLDGCVLRSTIRKGYIREGGLLRVNLGPISYAAVKALAVGESVTF